MIDPALLRHLGRRLAHVTAAANLPGIEANGLLPAADLANRAGLSPDEIALRPERTRLAYGQHEARLNHQKPILHGMEAANSIVDGHDARSWAEALDMRVFFWPERKANAAFRDSVARDVPIKILWFDTARLIEYAGDCLHLSPINSGNFTQGGARARRGDWLYVPVTEGLTAFRTNRIRRGLAQSPDTVREISLLGAIPPNDLAALRVVEDDFERQN